VLHELRARGLPLRGHFVGLRGNLGALAAGRRYLARDLNRSWSAAEIEGLLRAPGEARDEDREQRALLQQFVPWMRAAREPIVFLDLHSTSGPGAPFTCMADVLRNRPVALALPVPLILGIEELLDGSLLGYACDLGHAALAVEGGQNDDPRTEANQRAALWLALAAAGALTAREIGDLDAHRATLRDAARGLPAVVEIRHRHVVREGDGFEMLPGFANFTPLRRGQVVASDRHGPVRAPEDGLMLMPRYQPQGDDGWFLARPVSPAWLTLSALLRRARLDRLVPLLPGVRRHPERPDHFVADPRVARFQVRNVFHLFGYRHERRQGEAWVFARRRPGFHGLRELPPELRALDPPAGTTPA
jgi:succinylglutamate desuccinylase